MKPSPGTCVSFALTPDSQICHAMIAGVVRCVDPVSANVNAEPEPEQVTSRYEELFVPLCASASSGAMYWQLPKYRVPLGLDVSQSASATSIRPMFPPEGCGGG